MRFEPIHLSPHLRRMLIEKAGRPDLAENGFEIDDEVFEKSRKMSSSSDFAIYHALFDRSAAHYAAVAPAKAAEEADAAPVAEIPATPEPARVETRIAPAPSQFVHWVQAGILLAIFLLLAGRAHAQSAGGVIIRGYANGTPIAGATRGSGLFGIDCGAGTTFSGNILTCPGTGGGGGSTIFTSWKFGSASAITSANNYLELAFPAIFTTVQSGSGTSGAPFVDTLGLASQSANYFWAAPNGSSGAPTFRPIVPTDVPTLNQSTSGNAATATALASAPTNCAAGSYTLGINVAGVSQGCTALAPVATSGSASDLGTGTLPHARLPTLLSGDIPNNAANTSGTAANLSGTPALPNGTTATTQTAADNSTKLATTAYVDSGLAGKQAAITLTTTGSSGAATLTGGALNIPQYSGGGGGGGGINPQTTNYTAASGDAGKLITMNGASLTLTLPSPPPSATWYTAVLNLAGSSLTVSRNGMLINGAAGDWTTYTNAIANVWTDGTNYFISASVPAGAFSGGDINIGSARFIGNGVTGPGDLSVIASGGDVTFSANHANAHDWGVRSGTAELRGLSTSLMTWVNGSSFTDTANTGVQRDSAGVVGIVNGTQGTTAANYRDLKLRHTLASGTAPSITSGFGTAPAIAGADGAGRLTVGTGGTSATGVITFGTAFSTAPACVANDESTIKLVQATATTTTLTLTAAAAFTASDLLTWICTGY